MTRKFSPDWLALREPYDARARSETLAKVFFAAMPARPHILDIGAGRGANVRYLERIETSAAAWRLVDHDPELLERVDGLRGNAVQQTVDFAPDPALIDRTGIHGVSASAFFDLVSEAWFTAFVRAFQGMPMLFALTADGSHGWDPVDWADETVMTLFDADTRRDKGFGPAMGSDSPVRMAAVLAAAGYSVRQMETPWQLGGADADLLTALVDLIAGVSSARGDAPTVVAWRERKRRLIAGRALHLEVGHVDIVALPPESTGASGM